MIFRNMGRLSAVGSSTIVAPGSFELWMILKLFECLYYFRDSPLAVFVWCCGAAQLLCAPPCRSLLSGGSWWVELHNQLAADVRLTSLPVALSLSRHRFCYTSIFGSLLFFNKWLLLPLDLECVSIFVVAKSRAVTFFTHGTTHGPMVNSATGTMVWLWDCFLKTIRTLCYCLY